MTRRNFTDKFVRSLKAAPTGKRVEHWDAKVPCFGVRVTDTAHKTYVLYLRWPAPDRDGVGNACRASHIRSVDSATPVRDATSLIVSPLSSIADDASS